MDLQLTAQGSGLRRGEVDGKDMRAFPPFGQIDRNAVSQSVNGRNAEWLGGTQKHLLRSCFADFGVNGDGVR